MHVKSESRRCGHAVTAGRVNCLFFSTLKPESLQQHVHTSTTRAQDPGPPSCQQGRGAGRRWARQRSGATEGVSRERKPRGSSHAQPGAPTQRVYVATPADRRGTTSITEYFVRLPTRSPLVRRSDASVFTAALGGTSSRAARKALSLKALSCLMWKALLRMRRQERERREMKWRRRW